MKTKGSSYTRILADDPIVQLSRNDAFEWAAQRIEGDLMGEANEQVIEFGRHLAQAIRDEKQEVKPQHFEDAIRNDVYMFPEVKAAWLKLSEKGRK